MYLQQKATLRVVLALLLTTVTTAFEKGRHDQLATLEQSNKLLRRAFGGLAITDEDNKEGGLRGGVVAAGRDYEVIVLTGNQTLDDDEDYEDFDIEEESESEPKERETQSVNNGCFDEVGNPYGIFDSGPNGVDNWYRIIIRFTKRGLYETVPDPDLACSTGDIDIQTRRKGFLEYIENSWEIDYVGECSDYTPARATLTQTRRANRWIYRWYNSLEADWIQHQATIKFRRWKKCRGVSFGGI
eukprot:scaffold337_cov172-Amphora_coffeaeformis.AAC.23